MDKTGKTKGIHKGNSLLPEEAAEKYYDDIYRFCCYQTGSTEDAYDCAQETFIRFIPLYGQLQGQKSEGLSAYDSRNVCRDYFKRAAREQEFMKGQLARAEEESREEQTDESQYQETLLSALTSLPEMQREALILYYYDELSIREIARITETNAATVKSRLHQGKLKLKKYLEEA